LPRLRAFLVFFDWDRSDITPEAAAILDRAAEAYVQTGQTSVVLAGHADKSGAPDYNVRLSQRRADAVKNYMASKGISGGQITTEAFGESRPLVDTADGVREPQNRRVEITFGGSGMSGGMGTMAPANDPNMAPGTMAPATDPNMAPGTMGPATDPNAPGTTTTTTTTTTPM
jgi:hypothetical protein